MTAAFSLPEADQDNLPLKGVRVLDLSRALAGPYCAQVLSDLGADVVKIEQPARRDEMRDWPPFIDDLSIYFAVANRNKRCLALDLKQSAGRDLMRRLAAKADVVIENFRYGVAEQLGVGFEDLRTANPRIIVCSIRGYGKGPHENRPAYDAAIQAFTGIMSVTGEKDGEVQRAGVAVIDFSSGLFGACGVLGALQKREREGRGSHVEVALADSGISLMAYHLVTYMMTGRIIERAGTTHPAMAPCKAFRARDERGILIVVGNNEQFASLCRVLGREDWAADARFATPAARIANRDNLHGLIQEVLATRDQADWLAALQDAGIPLAPVNCVDDLAVDDVFRARMLAPVGYQGLDLKLVRSPILFDGEALPVRAPPPLHGEHTAAILADLGLQASEIEDLTRAGVVRAAAR